MYGKVATAVYIVTGVVTMTFNYLEQPSGLVDVCIYASLGMAVMSGLHYIAHVARTVDNG
jgi:hypothetical protein